MKKKLFIKIICLLFLLSFSLSLVFFYRSPIKKDVYFSQKEEEKKDVEPQTDDYDEGVSQGYLTFLIPFFVILVITIINIINAIIKKKEISYGFCKTLKMGFLDIIFCILVLFIAVFFVHLFSKNKKSFLFHLKNVYFFLSRKRIALLSILIINNFLPYLVSKILCLGAKTKKEEVVDAISIKSDTESKPAEPAGELT